MVGYLANLLGAADSNLTSAISQVTTYFSNNIPAVIGVFIAIAGLLWLLHLAFSSAGVKRRSRVG